LWGRLSGGFLAGKAKGAIMSATEFLTMAFSLSCTLGPAIGAAVFVVSILGRWLVRRGFLVTIGMPGQQKEGQP